MNNNSQIKTLRIKPNSILERFVAKQKNFSRAIEVLVLKEYMATGEIKDVSEEYNSLVTNAFEAKVKTNFIENAPNNGNTISVNNVFSTNNDNLSKSTNDENFTEEKATAEVDLPQCYL